MWVPFVFFLSFPFFLILSFPFFLILSYKMSEWTPVLSKKEAKQYKAVQRVLNRFSKSVDFASLVDANGLPIPVDMHWPTVEKKVSPLLSEACGSTKGCDLHDGLDNYPQYVKFLSEYPVPIYHISSEENRDMGYVKGYSGRRPYTESITIKIWTFAAPDVPVIHQYNLDVDGVQRKNVSCTYMYSYSPLSDDEYCMMENEECLLALSKLI